MNWCHNRMLKSVVLVFLLSLSLVAGGCEGTDTRNKVDDTVEEIAGKKNLDRYQQMKDDLGEIETRETERYRQLDDNTE